MGAAGVYRGAVTPDQQAAKDALDTIEQEILETAARPNPHPLPWRVSKRGNVLDACETIVLRPIGPDRRIRRVRGWVLANAANAVGAEATAEQAERYAIAAQRWAEVRPPEPGGFTINGHHFEVADMNRVTSQALTEAMQQVVGDMLSVRRIQPATITFTIAA